MYSLITAALLASGEQAPSQVINQIAPSYGCNGGQPMQPPPAVYSQPGGYGVGYSANGGGMPGQTSYGTDTQLAGPYREVYRYRGSGPGYGYPVYGGYYTAPWAPPAYYGVAPSVNYAPSFPTYPGGYYTAPPYSYPALPSLPYGSVPRYCVNGRCYP